MDANNGGGSSYQTQIDSTMDESLASTRRIRQMAEESKQVGAETLQNLDDQGQKLDQINNNMNRIRDNVKKGEKDLHEMEKCCGLCVCPWNRPATFKKEYAGTWGSTNAPVSASRQADRAIASNRLEGKDGRGNFQKIVEGDAREDEMEENLDAVGDILGDLKAQANAMNDELVRQDGVINTIDEKMTENDRRIQAASRRTDKLIKRN